MSEVKVNKISPRTACGTVTLGDSGDTFTIPAGATITNNGTAAGFGATGAASWDTTVKTSGFTAVNGVGYFVNTTAGAISVNLPAGTAGDVVAIKDYANTFDTNAVTLVQNGSDKIGGSTVNATLSTEGLAVTLVFVDATQGWLVTDNGTQDTAATSQYVTATGGTPTTSPCGDYKIHTFTGPGALCVSCAGNAAGSNTVEYLVVAGGGSGLGGGAGAGGFRFASPSLVPLTYPAKPLAAPAGLAVPVASYPITVGAGGTGGASGSNSIFSSITSAGGGRGGAAAGVGPAGYEVVAPGGSGGAGGQDLNSPGGNGNTPPVSPPQGNNGAGGGVGGYGSAGGGGGAIAAGSLGGGPGAPAPGGAGGVGAGLPNAFGTSGQSSGGSHYFSGGGGGGSNCCGGGGGTGGAAGLGGGGSGGNTNASNGTAGTINTGGGAGGNEYDNSTVPNSQAGGSGIVIIRYKFQN